MDESLKEKEKQVKHKIQMNTMSTFQLNFTYLMNIIRLTLSWYDFNFPSNDLGCGCSFCFKDGLARLNEPSNDCCIADFFSGPSSNAFVYKLKTYPYNWKHKNNQMDVQPHHTIVEDVQPRHTIVEDVQPHRTIVEDVQPHHTIVEDVQPHRTIVEDVQPHHIVLKEEYYC